jgi:hypothetical protein
MKQLLIYLFFLSLLFTCTGCPLFSPYECLILELPDIPGHWEQRFEEITFSIEYPDISGEKEVLFLPPGVSSCEIRVPKKRNWPVVAQPCGDEFPLSPAGALYPWHVDKNNRVLHLYWEHGFSALVFLECLGKGFDISCFNARRFMSEVLKRSEGDPWRLDFSCVAEQLTSGSFRVYDIKKLPVRDVSLSLTAGDWFFSSSFSPLVHSNGEAPCCIEDIPSGFHRLFHPIAPVWYELFVTEKEMIAVYYRE